MKQKHPTRLDLEGLAKLAVERGRDAYKASLRYRLDDVRVLGSSGEVLYELVSQNRGSQWHPQIHYIPVTAELAELLKPLFPHALYEKSRVWLTLKSICKRLGKTGVAAKIQAAQKKAREEQDATDLQVLRNRISNTAHEMLKRAERRTENKMYRFLSPDEKALLGKLQRAAEKLLEVVPYEAEVRVGDDVRIPHPPRGTDDGVVREISGRRITVEIKHIRRRAEFDASEVKPHLR